MPSTASLSPALRAMAVSRAFAGASSWISPRHAWRFFLLGPMPDAGSTALVSRLFGIRDLVLALGLGHSDPAVRRAVLTAGVVVDSADVVATALALRSGAPRAGLLAAAAGAGTFIVIGATALAHSD
ncbi:hypothetical protein [Mycolicibacterium chlorophenolicum]|uniref:DUF4267 domain-containing protein n=1 Tax=Mycolicibacterium chlorophenolicum TaxID=37916 RepID=A0A0J6WJH3_9MYCO|nr:hypothetical protein [Mycolicibacterium chlorophenolicum]KMO83480.1 hypothetical protein MCHLDSM_00407 [Mycolicibacterium chlorophenolicum]